MSIDLSLDRLRDFLPHLPVKFQRPTIHIAGTNGKGSVSVILSSILLCSNVDIRVGRYNSPHLTKVADCIVINNEPIDDATYEAVRAKVESLNLEHGANLTPFEILTVTALQVFETAQVDVAVIEVGMGGRFDATNIIPTECILVSALTTVDLDHQQFLGPTIEDIAKEKLGVARAGKPFVLGRQRYAKVETLARAILEQAGALLVNPIAVEKRNWNPDVDGPAPAPFSLHPSSDRGDDLPPPSPVEFILSSFQEEPIQAPFPLPGDHQLSNLSTALGVIEALPPFAIPKARITVDTIREGLRKIQWRGRLSWHHLDLEKFKIGDYPCDTRLHPILVDGAHNQGSGQALANYIDQILSGLPPGSEVQLHYIIGISSSPSKSPRETLFPLLTNLHPSVKSAIAYPVRFTSPEHMPWVKPVTPSDLEEVCRGLRWGSSDCDDERKPLGTFNFGLYEALKRIVAEIPRMGQQQQLLILVTGSLYLVADFYRLLVNEFNQP